MQLYLIFYYLCTLYRTVCIHVHMHTWCAKCVYIYMHNITVTVTVIYFKLTLLYTVHVYIYIYVLYIICIYNVASCNNINFWYNLHTTHAYILWSDPISFHIYIYIECDKFINSEGYCPFYRWFAFHVPGALKGFYSTIQQTRKNNPKNNENFFL